MDAGDVVSREQVDQHGDEGVGDVFIDQHSHDASATCLAKAIAPFTPVDVTPGVEGCDAFGVQAVPE